MANDDAFDSPASGNFKAKDYPGRLLLITPKEYLTAVKTVNGDKDAVDGEVVVIDETDPTQSEVIDNGRLFGGQLIAATKPKIGRMVLGRLTQGVAKPGQKPPWLLNDPTEDDRVKARAFLATRAPQL